MDPSNIQWGASDAEYVVESTGAFTGIAGASKHMDGERWSFSWRQSCCHFFQLACFFFFTNMESTDLTQEVPNRMTLNLPKTSRATTVGDG